MKVKAFALTSAVAFAAMVVSAGTTVTIKCDERVVHDGGVNYMLYSAPDTVRVGVRGAMFNPADSTLTIEAPDCGGDYILQLLTEAAPANDTQIEVTGEKFGNRVTGMQLTDDYLLAFRRTPSKWLSFSLAGDAGGAKALTIPD